MRYTKIFLKFRTKKVLLQYLLYILRKKCIFVIVNIFLAVPCRMNEGEIFTVHINCDVGQGPEIYSLHQNLPPFYYNLFTARKRKEGSPEMRTKYIFLLYPPPCLPEKKKLLAFVQGKTTPIGGFIFT